MSKTTKTSNEDTIQVNERNLVDPETGEVVTVKQIVQRSKDANFEKVWLMHLLDAINEVTTRKFDVMRYFIEHKNNQNMVIANQQEIADDLGAAIKTVSEAVQILKKKDFMSMVKPGVYRLNPNHIFKGGHGQRMDVLRTYYKEKSPPAKGQASINDKDKKEEK